VPFCPKAGRFVVEPDPLAVPLPLLLPPPLGAEGSAGDELDPTLVPAAVPVGRTGCWTGAVVSVELGRLGVTLAGLVPLLSDGDREALATTAVGAVLCLCSAGRGWT
jgi:hypothetical protein